MNASSGTLDLVLGGLMVVFVGVVHALLLAASFAAGFIAGHLLGYSALVFILCGLGVAALAERHAACK